MFCRNCGKELKAEYNVCPNCGCVINNDNIPASKVDVTLKKEKVSRPPMSAMAIVGFVFGILGFESCAILSIPGLILSIIAFNQIKKGGYRGKSFALAGIITSAISLGLWVILWAFYIGLLGTISAPQYALFLG